MTYNYHGLQTFRSRKLFLIGAAVAVGASLALTAILKPVSAATTTTVRALDGSYGWTKTTRDTGDVNIAGTYGAPSGFGSSALVFATPLSNDKAYVKSTELAGQNLSTLSSLAYATYRDSTSTYTAGVVPALNVEIAQPDGSGYTTLVFEPIYQAGGAAAVQTNTWQNWNAINSGDAIWWSTRTVGGITGVGDPGTYEQHYVRWGDIVAANPNAVILSIAVNQGGGNQGLLAAADAVTVNSTTYDFEALPANASTKQECMNGNWVNFQANYKNQGQCVASVVSNDHSKLNRQ